MLLTFLGYRHFKGTSKKTNTEYDFTSVYFLDSSPSDGTVGQMPIIATAGKELDLRTLEPGREYDVVLYFNNGKYIALRAFED